MKVALIGYGYWGKILAKYLVQDSFFELTAIYTSQKDVVLGTNSLDDIEESKAEAVFIASPSETHYEMCHRFLSADKHVFCEKPFVKPKLAKELYALADQKEKCLYVNYIYTCSASIHKMKALLPRLGEIKQSSFMMRQYGKFYKEANAFETLGCHMLSCYHFFYGSDDITGRSIQSSEKNLKQKLIFDERKTSFDISLLTEQKNCEIRLEGENRTLVFSPLEMNTVQFISLNDTESQNFAMDEKNNIARCFSLFEAIIKKEQLDNRELVLWVAEMLYWIRNENS